MGVVNLSESTLKKAGANGVKLNGTQMKVPGRTDRTASVKDAVKQRTKELKAERNRGMSNPRNKLNAMAEKSRTDFLNKTSNSTNPSMGKASREPMLKQLNSAVVKAANEGKPMAKMMVQTALKKKG